ncbi:MAG: M28 family peptidase [Bacteroidales bacterium]
MKKFNYLSLIIVFGISTSLNQTFGQSKLTGQATINASDLRNHMSFLASPLLKGRPNGGEGLEVAARYLATQAGLIGLKPANEGSFYKSYPVVKKSIDPDKTSVTVISGDKQVVLKDQLFQLVPMGASDYELEGDIVFAGYGLKLDKYKYNDLDTLKITGKVLLVLNRAPLESDGKTCKLGDKNLLGMQGLQMKLQSLMMARPKAVLIVTDPKSGFQSFDQANPGLAEYLVSSTTLKGQKGMTFDMPGVPKIIFIHRNVADAILSGTGHTLAELQDAIDLDLKCHSFAIPSKKIKISEASITKENLMPNIAGIIEGSDPVLKNEVIIYSAHMDHIGGTGDKINPGADDDASGCVALLEIAQAYSSLPKKPLRTIMFLWVSGEEVGLFGSQSYVENPIFPLDKTVADLNIDMIGRVKGVADTSKENPMTGPKGVFVISDNQSKELNSIADAVASKTGLTLDYSLSGRDHPLSLFSRSDHFNFVRKNIPILFFTSGIHTDYHTPGDVIEKIDFNKVELVAKTMFEIGQKVANQKNRIVVDNPFTKNTTGQ